MFNFFKKAYYFITKRSYEDDFVYTTLFKETPLTLACYKGHKDVVEYLIDYCHIDVNQTGTVIVREEDIHGASPLWCASAANHLSIVKLLLEKGANVNAITNHGSTPLRAACYNGYYNIVEYLIKNGADVNKSNKHGHTCLMIASLKGHINVVRLLLNSGAEINQISDKKLSALHYSAEEGHLEIVKLLIKYGANINIDSYLTPLMLASSCGKQNVVDYFIESQYYTREEKINALELLGAAFIDINDDILSAYCTWCRAFTERNKQPVIFKTIDPVHKKVFDYILEFKTENELENIRNDAEKMQMQALMIRERVIRMHYVDVCYFIEQRGFMYANNGQIDRLIDLWIHALDFLLELKETANNSSLSILMSLKQLFEYMILENSINTLENIVLDVIKKAIEHVKCSYIYYLDQSDLILKESILTYLINATQIIFRLMFLFIHLIKNKNKCPVIKIEFYKTIDQLVKLNMRLTNGRNILHLALESNIDDIISSYDLVKILLKLGMNPNDEDDVGNRALHYAAKLCYSNKILVLLLNYGAHYDTKNIFGHTYYSIASQNYCTEFRIQKHKYITLQCLAARVIKESNIPYTLLPVHLIDFIIDH